MDLDSLLELEESFYVEGYNLGVKDGETAGFNEGSVFGIENGFEKFQAMGRLYGKGIIWAKRLPGNHNLLHSSNPSNGATGNSEGQTDNAPDDESLQLPNLQPNPRLEKHLAAFLSLVDPLTLTMENNEDAVADFDERLKKATIKAKIIQKILGESNSLGGEDKGKTSGQQSSGFGNIEDIGPIPPRMMQQP